jgi:hypothetical protein
LPTAKKALIAIWMVVGVGCKLDTSLKHRCETAADCLAGRVCVRSVCEASSGDGPHPNYMFVTSRKYPTRFQPLEVADGRCNEAAEDAGLPGNYRAWLSTSAVYARDRLAGARGWVRTDGQPFADTVDDIAGGRILTPPLLDEKGHEVVSSASDMPEAVPTGTNAFGLVDPGLNCREWANDEMSATTIGYTVGTTALWTAALNMNCGPPMRLYCFGVDQAFALAPGVPSGRRAFLSEKSFMPASGIAGADAVCAAEAGGAGLAGTFLALLATTDASAASRFDDAPGANWLRMDGVAIGAAGVGPFSGALLNAPLNLTLAGEYIANEAVVTGAERPRDPSINSNASCANWVDGLANANIGSPSRVDRWFFDGGVSCSYPGRVYCFEH